MARLKKKTDNLDAMILTVIIVKWEHWKGWGRGASWHQGGVGVWGGWVFEVGKGFCWD